MRYWVGYKKEKKTENEEGRNRETWKMLGKKKMRCCFVYN